MGTGAVRVEDWESPAAPGGEHWGQRDSGVLEYMVLRESVHIDSPRPAAGMPWAGDCCFLVSGGLENLVEPEAVFCYDG